MLLGGLWHGASLTFVVWGGLHGVGLACNRAWRDWRNQRAVSKTKPSWFQQAIFLLLTFHFVCAAWVFFRAESFEKAAQIFQVLGARTFHTTHLSTTLLQTLGAGLIGHFVPARLFQWLKTNFWALRFYQQGLLLFTVAVFLRAVASSDEVPFVYFQF